MKKYTLYKDDRHSSQLVSFRITAPTRRNGHFGCAECGRPFKKRERILKVSFRWLAPRTFCSGCAHEKLTEAIQALGKVYKKGEGYKPYEYPEWLQPKKYEVPPDDGIPF